MIIRTTILGSFLTLLLATNSAVAAPHPKFKEAQKIKRNELISHIDNPLKSNFKSSDAQELINLGIDPPLNLRPLEGKGLGINRKHGITITGMRAPEEPPGGPNPRAGMPGFNSFLPSGMGLSQLIQQVLGNSSNSSVINPPVDACGHSGQKTAVPTASSTIPMPCGGTVTLKETKMHIDNYGSRVGFVDHHIHKLDIYRLKGDVFRLEQSVTLPNMWCREDDEGNTQMFPFKVIEQFFSIGDAQEKIYVELDPEESDPSVNAAVDFIPVTRNTKSNSTSWSPSPNCQEKHVTLAARPNGAAPVGIAPYDIDSCDTLQQFPRTAACKGTFVEVNLDAPSIIIEPEDELKIYDIEGRNESIVPLTPTSALYTSFYSDVVLGYGKEMNLIDGATLVLDSGQTVGVKGPNNVKISSGGLVTLSLGGTRYDAKGKTIGKIPKNGTFSVSSPPIIRTNGAIPMNGNAFFPINPGDNVRFANDSVARMQNIVTQAAP